MVDFYVAPLKHPTRSSRATKFKEGADSLQFSDATSSTQVKYANVNTAGNAVWDSEARTPPSTSPIPSQYDDLPAFSVLTTDYERERKAGTQRPGTFGVVVTPDSFSELPEYASASAHGSRRASVQSHTSSFGNQTPPLGRPLTRIRTDPHVVVLDKFEDVPTASPGSFSVPSPARRPSLPDGLQYLSITAPQPANVVLPNSPLSSSARRDDQFMARFRHYIAPRLFQPQVEGVPSEVILPGSTRDAFELQAARFQPVCDPFRISVGQPMLTLIVAPPRSLRSECSQPCTREPVAFSRSHATLPPSSICSHDHSKYRRHAF